MILRKLPSLALSALCFSSLPFTTASLSPSDIPPDTPVTQLLSLAQTQLTSGNAQDALTYFDVAVQKDPSNYLTLFKRGATYLSLGKNSQASKDFDQVLVLKPGFEGALMQRGKIKGRGGDWEGARQDYVAAGKGKGSEEVKEVDEAKGAAKLAAEAEKGSDWEACVTQAGAAILVASGSLELRERRARCRFEKGEVVEGIADLERVLAINAAAIEPHLKISAMTYYSLGEVEKGLTAISRCLHNDPDNKECTKLRKAEKALDRVVKKVNTLLEKRQFASAVKLLVPSPDENGDKGLLQDVRNDITAFRETGYIHPKAPSNLYTSLLEKTCEAYVEMNNAKKAQQYCDEVLTLNADSLPALLNKAQRQIDADDFEPALGTLNHAKEVHGNNQKVQKLMQEAQTLLKRSKQKDYYKVLGLDRSASEQEIKRAMRKLTKQHHPDKAAAHGISPEEAQKKMSAINEAYEVLSDPELKARFDRGEDPNDPMQQGQQPFQGSPFGFGAGGQPIFFQQRGGGFPGGSGGFKFQAGGGGGGFPFGGGGGFPGGFPFG